MKRLLTRRRLLQRAGTIGAAAAVSGALPIDVAFAEASAVPDRLTPDRIETLATLVGAVAAANGFSGDTKAYLATALDGRQQAYALGSEAQRGAINEILDELATVLPNKAANASTDDQVRAVRALREALPRDPKERPTPAQLRTVRLWSAAVGFGSPPFDPLSEDQSPPLHV